MSNAVPEVNLIEFSNGTSIELHHCSFLTGFCHTAERAKAISGIEDKNSLAHSSLLSNDPSATIMHHYVAEGVVVATIIEMIVILEVVMHVNILARWWDRDGRPNLRHMRFSRHTSGSTSWCRS